MRSRKLAAEPLSGCGRRLTRLDPAEREQLRKRHDDLGYGSTTRRGRFGQPDQTSSLGLEEVLRRPGLQRLGEDLGAVLESEPSRLADRATRDRRLPDPLVGEERGQMLGMRAQVRQIHVVVPSGDPN